MSETDVPLTVMIAPTRMQLTSTVGENTHILGNFEKNTLGIWSWYPVLQDKMMLPMEKVAIQKALDTLNDDHDDGEVDLTDL